MPQPVGRGTSGVAVLVADRSPVFVQGLVAVLTRWPRTGSVTGVGTASDARDEMVRSPDLVVLDARLLATGSDLCRLGRDMGAAVVLTVSRETSEDLVSAVADGVRGMWDRDAECDDLLRTLSSAMDGHQVLSASGGAALFAQLAAASAAAGETAAETLTRREREILSLMAAGAGNRAIAEQLFISENTVRNHVRNVLDKLHARTRTEAVVRAARAGLVRLA